MTQSQHSPKRHYNKIMETLESTTVLDLLLKIAQGATTDENGVFGRAIGLYWSYGSTNPGLLIWTVNFVEKYLVMGLLNPLIIW